MSKDKKLLNIMKNGGLFFIVVAITLWIILSKANLKEIIKALWQVNVAYVAIAIVCMVFMVLCEALNIRNSLRIFREKTTFYQCIGYSLVGIFFSSVTPAATGGQPMQVYYMHKKKINISNAMLALLVCLASYQFVAVGMSIMSLIIKFDVFKHTLGKFIFLLYIGIGLNIAFLLIILVSIFSKRFIFAIVNLVVKIISLFSNKKALDFRKKALIEIDKYKKGATYLKNNKRFIVKTIFISILQISALHSIPFWVYKAFGMPGGNIIEFIAIQAALYITGAALPLPGAVGIGEGGFLIFFKVIFPAQLLSSAMLISRGISFYIMVIISGIAILILQLKLNKTESIKKG